MDAIHCIKTRRSIRRYMGTPITREILEDIVACANLAPSARAAYPWKFVVVTDETLLSSLGAPATYGSFIAQASACIVVCGEVGNPNTPLDCSAATQNVLLGAKAHGVASCWVQGWKTAYSPRVAELLHVPKTHEVVALVALGYSAENPVPAKKPVKDVLVWERFTSSETS